MIEVDISCEICIGEDVKAVGLALLPVTVENGVVEIDESHAVHESLGPLGAVKTHIVVEDYTEAMTFVGGVEQSLVSSIAIVYNSGGGSAKVIISHCLYYNDNFDKIISLNWSSSSPVNF